MALRIDKTIAIRQGPFDRGIYLLILTKSEEYLQKILRNPHIRLFSVNYKEVKSTKPNYRMFHIQEGFNQRDK